MATVGIAVATFVLHLPIATGIRAFIISLVVVTFVLGLSELTVKGISLNGPLLLRRPHPNHPDGRQRNLGWQFTACLIAINALVLAVAWGAHA